MKQLSRDYKRIVIKVGSSLFYSDDNTLDFNIVNSLADQISRLVKDGKEIVVVSSGAIALGMPLLGYKERPKELYKLQAAAAIGQNELIYTYYKTLRSRLGSLGYLVGQVLLTWDDFSDRKRYLNAKTTLLALLKCRCIPIVNENDTVSTEEIKFGDNDRLSALVAGLVSADILIILSDIDGLLDKDKKVIAVVSEITATIRALACPTGKKTCVGGMITKIEAAKIAIDSGIPCVIANGRKDNILLSVVREPEKNGTLFLSKKCLTERERWIAFGTKTKGNIIVDDGAKTALVNGKSLLSVGIVSIEGVFDTGDIVSVRDSSDCEFARGKVRLSSEELDKIKGIRFDKEIIHRDNLVIL